MPRFSAAVADADSPPPQQPSQPPPAQPLQHPSPQEARLYRWPDGELRREKPPPNPYTVAARKAFHELVVYAALNGGDEEATRTGRSLRLWINCTYEEHKAYLAERGLEPERNADGSWIGFNPAKQHPIEARPSLVTPTPPPLTLAARPPRTAGRPDAPFPPPAEARNCARRRQLVARQRAVPVGQRLVSGARCSTLRSGGLNARWACDATLLIITVCVVRVAAASAHSSSLISAPPPPLPSRAAGWFCMVRPRYAGLHTSASSSATRLPISPRSVPICASSSSADSTVLYCFGSSLKCTCAPPPHANSTHSLPPVPSLGATAGDGRCHAAVCGRAPCPRPGRCWR